MGLFHKAALVRLKNLKNDLKKLIKIIGEHGGNDESDKVLMAKFLELEHLYKKIEKDGKSSFQVDFVKEYYVKGISESDLRNCSLTFKRFIDSLR